MTSLDFEAQQDELLVLTEILDSDSFTGHLDPKHNVLVGQIKIRITSKNGNKFCLTQSQLDNTIPSNNDCKATAELEHLPPLTLAFKCPSDYPSVSKPNFTLLSTWINAKMLSVLCSRLDQLWEENIGLSILHLWVDFLRENVAEIVDLENYQFDDITSESSDPRAIYKPIKFNETETFLTYLQRYDVEECHFKFISAHHDCPICFLPKKGIDLIRFSACGHYFCCDCVSSHFTLQIHNGSVDQVICLHLDCQSLPSQSEVKSVVSTEDFERYDRLLLSRSLNGMGDVIYCPRLQCQSPGFPGQEDNLAVCLACGFSFCTECKKCYHGVEDCFPNRAPVPETKNEVEIGESPAVDGDDQEDCKDEKKRASSLKRVKCLIEKIKYDVIIFEEARGTRHWVETNCQPCPGCNVAINKDGGCNHMCCSACNSHFMWDALERTGVTPPIWLGGKRWLRHRLYEKCNCDQFGNESKS